LVSKHRAEFPKFLTRYLVFNPGTDWKKSKSLTEIRGGTA